MYDAFSTDYDRFVNWPERLAYEMPFIEQQLESLEGLGDGPLRVLDAACGTGMHAIALARRGYVVSGADSSAGMIERARENAAAAGVTVRFEQVGFGELRRTFGERSCDVVLCLGNSLPHVLAAQELTATLNDFAACLRPGGLALIQNRNFDAVMAAHARWMDPQGRREEDRDWVFVRFYDFEPDGLINFNILTLKRTAGERDAGGDWQQQVTTTQLRPLLQQEFAEALGAAGFDEASFYGSMSGERFVAQSSGNLIVAARLGQV